LGSIRDLFLIVRQRKREEKTWTLCIASRQRDTCHHWRLKSELEGGREITIRLWGPEGMGISLKNEGKNRTTREGTMIIEKARGYREGK